MAGLSDLPGELWHLTTAVFKELVNIWRSPWRFHMFLEEVGALDAADWPRLFARMEALVDQEYTAESLDDALGLIDGFVEAIRLANETPGARRCEQRCCGGSPHRSHALAEERPGLVVLRVAGARSAPASAPTSAAVGQRRRSRDRPCVAVR